MKTLKEELQVSGFNSNFEELILNLMVTHNHLLDEITYQIKQHQITHPQFNVLRILKGQKGNPVTVNFIIDRMFVRTSNASRIVDKLEDQGYVSRVANPLDKRSVHIVITQKGIAKTEHVSNSLKDLKNSFKHFKSKDIEQLNQLLNHFRDFKHSYPKD
jgi:DNA-binding MarR family transcriptional regulator